MADKRWVGGAAAVADVWELTLGGTYASAEDVTITIGDVAALTVTIGTDASLAGIAEALAAAVNAENKTANLVADETRDFGGLEFLEFTGVTASFAGGVVTLSHSTPGYPIDVSVSTDSALGTIVAANSTPATGPNFLSNADNWTPSIPVAYDRIVFDSGNVDCLYDIEFIGDIGYQIDFLRTTDYTGRIGLPDTNADGYREYRPKRLTLVEHAEVSLLPGTQTLTGGITRIDYGGNEPGTIEATHAGTIQGDEPNLEIVGAQDSPDNEAIFGRGKFVAKNCSFPVMRVGDSETTESDTVFIADSLLYRAGASDTHEYLGGLFQWVTAPWALGASFPGIGYENVLGGTMELLGIGDFNTILIASGGVVKHKGAGKIGTANLNTRGTLSLEECTNTIEIPGIHMHGGSALLDPADRITGASLNLDGCTREDVTITGSL